MTTTSRRPDDPVATRLDALRSALADPAARPSGSTAGTAHGGAAGSPDEGRAGGPDGELAERLRSRRSAAHVAAAYSAAHGHPWHDDDRGGRRWGLAPVAAVAASAVLLLVVLVVAVLAWPRTAEDLGVTVSSGVEEAGAESAGPDDPGGRTPDGEPLGDSSLGDTPPGADPGDRSPGEDLGGAPVAADVVVHVVGEVAEPGLVTLPPGARVADAVEAAGGPTDEADLSAVNLARDVVDGEQVLVPAPGQATDVPAPAAAPAASGTSAGAGTGPVPLNTADAATLTQLSGVGPVLAERIITWRQENGPFTSVEELTEVSGIGPVLLAELRDQVVV
ncbi:helix-hairpin-helix domain-containing protein [Isoptericola jiangsuensis]|uniref:helix-hairpin-helix domain-containing protein n=1 Tax=Isoptericola jiangsuensis TaxID=548579 RepID=UPI003AAD5EF0